MDADQRPIGYWLKLLDRLIDESFERTMRDHGLTRRHWQVMNTLAQAPVSEPELVDALAPFLRDPTELTATVTDLRDREWFALNEDGQFELTGTGRQEYLLIRQRVVETRHLLAAGITAEEYHSTVGVLGRMAENLETALG